MSLFNKKDAQKEIADLKAENEQLKGNLASKEQELVDAKEDYEAELEKFEQRVEEKANIKAQEILASAGSTTAPVPTSSLDDGDSDLMAQYKKLESGQERIDFRNKHPELDLSK